MTWFSTVAQNVEQGFDWGVTAASRATSSAAKAGSYVADKAIAGANYAVDKGVAAGNYVADKAVAGANYAVDKGVAASNYVADKAVAGANYAVDKSVAAAKYTAQAASAGASYVGDQVVSGAKWAGNKAFERIRSTLDNRDSYKLRGDAVQQCPLSRDQHPNPNDGKFMGKDSCPCQGSPQLSDREPTGVFPDGCGPGCGKPKIYFTNGINNTEEDLCKTISALAESQCAEVVGIYNATYADKRLKGDGGMFNDVADCMDAIDESGKSAAAARMKESLVSDLNVGKKPVRVFAHSEGGLNSQTALREAQKELASQRLDQLIQAGMSDEDAIAAADDYATKLMANVEVTSFGTAAKGWVPGPAYTQYENYEDLVPKAIATAQFARQKGRNKTTTKNRYVEHRGLKGGGLPGHSMTGIYVPMLNDKNAAKRLPNGKCC